MAAASSNPMKLLVFAHTPPPFHAQSYMVQLMLEQLGGAQRKSKPGPKTSRIARPEDDPDRFQSQIECFHVNARLSDEMEDIGAFRIGKLLRLLRYCGEAIRKRLIFGIPNLYYVPAPGKRAALYRDWLVMLLCRPFFRCIVYHWHAVGLTEWLEAQGTQFERRLTQFLLGRPALSLVLAEACMQDAQWLGSKRIEVVPNGIPDPCPDFATKVYPLRQTRLEERRLLLEAEQQGRSCPELGDEPQVFRILYLAHCIAEKGVFDTLDAVALANSSLRARKSKLRLHLTVAGQFARENEEYDFRRRFTNSELAAEVTYVGVADPTLKRHLLRSHDCLCFPTYYHAESFGLAVLEAMAAGMAIITTRWRALPELLPEDYGFFVPPRAPQKIAAAFQEACTYDASALRTHFLNYYTEVEHARTLESKLHLVASDRAKASS